jgi:hypothetical protein
MIKNLLLTEEELNKVALTKFILQLFNQYKELYLISIALYNCSVVEKGKMIGSKPKLQLSTTFKYDTFYCFWFNGGAQSYEDAEELKNHVWHCSVQPLLNNYSPVKFYLKCQDRKMTYDDFESYILNNSEFDTEKHNSIFGKKNKITFCKDTIQTDIEYFLGNELLIKQQVYKDASLLSKELVCNNGKKTYIKI